MTVTLSRKKVMSILVTQTIIILALAGVAVQSEFENNKQNDDIEQTLDNGRGIISCLVTYAEQNSKALNDRDNINNTSVTAAIAWLDALLAQIGQAESPEQAMEVIEGLQLYRDALVKLVKPPNKGGFPRTPYPDIKECLRANGLPVPDDLREDAETTNTSFFRLTSAVVVYAGQGHPGKWDNKCLHRKVTIRGTDGNDNISGTRGRDVIFAYSGDDLVAAGRGRDRICGRFGGDVLNGENGFDRINGGNGGGLDLCFGERTKKCP